MAKTVKQTEDKNIDIDNIIKERDSLAELIKQMKKEMTEMKKQIENKQQPNIVVEQTKVVSRKAKVISLIHNMLILSTEEMGAGRVFKFPKYGDSNIIKLDDLDKIMAIPTYRKQAEKGIFYICDADIVEELGLSEDYEKINDKEKIDKILELKDDIAVDLFFGLSKMLQETTAKEMAIRLNKGYNYDLNLLARISRNTDFNIEKIAQDFQLMKK